MSSQLREPPISTLRPMTVDDVERVMSIASQSANAPDWSREVYVSSLTPRATPIRVAFVAERGGIVEGFVIASIVASEAELESIAVAPAAQRQGIASALLDRLIAELRAADARCVRLEVRESNAPARAMYERAGFQQIGRRRAYYHSPTEDALLFELRIP